MNQYKFLLYIQGHPTGVSREALSLEFGEFKLDERHLRNLCKIFDITPNDLFRVIRNSYGQVEKVIPGEKISMVTAYIGDQR